MGENGLLNRNVIVVGSDHVNTLGVVRSLGSNGIYPVVLITSSAQKSWVLASRYVRVGEIVDYDKRGIVDAVLRYSHGSFPSWVIPTNDYIEMVLDESYDVLSATCRLPGCGAQLSVKENMNPVKMLSVARSAGISVPKSITEVTEYRDSLKQCELLNEYLPLFMRRYDSVSGRKAVCVVQDRQSLEAALCDGQFDTIVMQEFIRIDEEFGVQGVGFGEGSDPYIPATVEKVRTSRTALGSTTYARLVRNELVEGMARDFVRATNFDGVFDIEIMRSGDKYYFNECNFRNGAYGYAYTKAGFNLPVTWLEQTCPVASSVPQGFTLMNEFSDFRNIGRDTCSISAWIKEFLGANARMTIDMRDPAPLMVRLLWRKQVHH